MKLIIRFGGAALLLVTLVVFAVLPYATVFVDQWSRRDVELRSRLVFNSVRDQVALLLSQQSGDKLGALFERIASDERLLAIGYCDGQGALRYTSREMPTAFTCEKVARSEAESFSTLTADGRRLAVSAFPIPIDGGRAHLIILHDLTFAAQRGAQAQAYLIVLLAGVAVAGVALASVIAVLFLRRSMQSIGEAIDDIRADRTQRRESVDIAAVGGREIQKALQDLRARHSLNAIRTAWDPKILQMMLQNELPDAQVIIVSNREPYIHNRTSEGVLLQRPASGLVAALEPVARACGGAWIAHGSGSADRETVDIHDRVAVPPNNPSYALRRLWLTEEEQDGYYYGFANEGLWALCHIAFVRPVFRDADWHTYRAVNQRFADAVVAESKTPNPIVLVQDYHLALLPSMVRARLPQATIITFWHIPWPNSETFGICPYKEEIIESLLGSSVVGFHTQFHCNNFLDTVDRFLESRIDREYDTVTFAGHETLVRPYPISIEWPHAALAGQKPVEACRAAVRQRFGLDGNVRIGVGIERFDYTKGILDRMRAVDSFLTDHPAWLGRFVFIQVAAPTRSKLESYRNLQDEAVRLAEEINRRHGKERFRPILLLARHHEPDEVFELFRAADLCMVSSLHDGMNLVAKEFVAARDDEHGVLILSAFAGASRELSEALIINPYDARATGQAIERGLTMSKVEQRERMKLMRDQVRERNVYRWAGEMLLDAARLRQRQRIEMLAASV